MVRVDDRTDIAPGVVTITLDRPERRNALAHSTLLELIDVQASLDDARAIVLTGEPPAFCAGADLTGVDQHTYGADLDRVLRGFVSLPAPVIAAIDGPALGAGAQLVAVADLRVATPESVIGVPAAKLGLVIDHWTLGRIRSEFGPPIARAMLLAAETFSGERLHDAGVVHRIGTLDVALSWAGEIARLAPLSVAAHKLGLDADDGHDLARYDAARETAWGSEDAAEGRRAFLEKRPATFVGR